MKVLLWNILFLLFASSLFGGEHDPYVLVLGISQDGGYPHMGCERDCCARAWKDPKERRFVVSLALVDPSSGKWWLFDATPDIREQLHLFRTLTASKYPYLPEGIFLTHAHIGHYTGLMELGREVMNTKDVPVYVLPRMKAYLEANGPWSQLVKLHNIDLRTLAADSGIVLTNSIIVTPFKVPHRDEYSETAGFSLKTPIRKYLFIPDINKWEKWQRSIEEVVKTADVAFLDASFYDNNELPTRNMKEILHPLVTETMAIFDKALPPERDKIYFIHLNHTNPLLWDKAAKARILRKGYHVAEQGKRY